MRKLALILVTLSLAGCGQSADQAPAPASTAPPQTAPAATAVESASEKLAEILAKQPQDVRDRYAYRHPQETLEFFGIEPGMTVVEALPGGGWYSKIIIPYLGPDGRLIGADYAREMYSNFGFADAEFMEAKKTWVSEWSAMANGWHGENGAPVSAFVFGSLPAEMHGTADAVLLIRALHNLARFESDGGYLTAALTDSYNVLKSGGVVGIVQHEAREAMPDDWANGQNGYLKRSFIVSRMEALGFELVGSSDINANERDQPTTEDVVWRLPPSYGTSEGKPELRAAMEAIGESNRMTLLFRKP
jgi:predicted methyltransferase